jgi:hypothetical protein
MRRAVPKKRWHVHSGSRAQLKYLSVFSIDNAPSVVLGFTDLWLASLCSRYGRLDLALLSRKGVCLLQDRSTSYLLHLQLYSLSALPHAVAPPCKPVSIVGMDCGRIIRSGVFLLCRGYVV